MRACRRIQPADALIPRISPLARISHSYGHKWNFGHVAGVEPESAARAGVTPANVPVLVPMCSVERVFFVTFCSSGKEIPALGKPVQVHLLAAVQLTAQRDKL